MNRPLPYDYEAEGLIIGSILDNNELLTKANEILFTSEAFYKLENKIIFEIMNQLLLEKKNFDVTTINELIKQKELNNKVNVMYLLNLKSGLLFTDYCLIVLDKFLKRRTIEVSYNAAELCYNDNFNIINIIPETIEKLENLRYTFETETSNGTSLLNYMNDLVNGTIADILTGFEKLDNIIKGFRYGHYNILAARPKTGKTTFIINLLYNQCVLSGIPIRFYSLEQPKDEILFKLLCRVLEESEDNVKNENMPTEKIKVKYKFYDTLEKLPLTIVDGLYGINEIANDIITAKERVIYIDYNEYISTKANGIFEALDKVSKTFTKIAKNHKKAILMLQQIKTDVDNKEPGSDSIFMKAGIKDAAKIMLMYRLDEELYIKVSENRFGGIGKIRLDMDGSKSLITENKGVFYDDDPRF